MASVALHGSCLERRIECCPVPALSGPTMSAPKSGWLDAGRPIDAPSAPSRSLLAGAQLALAFQAVEDGVHRAGAQPVPVASELLHDPEPEDRLPRGVVQHVQADQARVRILVFHIVVFRYREGRRRPARDSRGISPRHREAVDAREDSRRVVGFRAAGVVDPAGPTDASMRIASPTTSSQRRARLTALLAALTLLFVSTSTFAMPAPLCNEHAQSSVAPFPILPTRNGEVRAPCSPRRGFALRRAHAPRRRRASAPVDPGGRAIPVAGFGLRRDRGRRLPPGQAVSAVTRPGHGLGVFRPPCG